MGAIGRSRENHIDNGQTEGDGDRVAQLYECVLTNQDRQAI